MVRTLNVALDEIDQALLTKQKGSMSWTDYLLTMNKNFETIHNNIHGLRLMKDYKPTMFELSINKIICELFQHSCKECAERLKKIQTPTNNTNKTFLGRLFDGSD